MFDPSRTAVTPEFKALSADLLRSAARGLLSSDSAYKELCRRLSATPGDPENPTLELPSRTWFDSEVLQRVISSQASAPRRTGRPMPPRLLPPNRARGSR